MYLPTLRALFSLNTPTPDAAAAIQALQTASRYDLALGRVGFIGRFGGLYPIYVRGIAYLAARQPAEAVGEFQRILDHRSIVLVDPMDAMAPAAGTSARALGRHREGEERLRRSPDALEECRPGHSGSQGSTGGVRATAVKRRVPLREPSRARTRPHLHRALRVRKKSQEISRSDTIPTHGLP